MNTLHLPTCPKCGLPLPVDAPKGLCPRCLAAMNLAGETALTGADAVAAQTPLTPAELAPHFPQLEILECLGRGGMGVVYKARQKSLNRFVALKLLAPERAKDPSFAERFAKEAQALAALNHPHIVGVYDFGQAGGFYFLLMEFVDGVNLRQAMKAGRFTPEQALAVVPPVCEALQYAHEHGIVHRDIKPENLLLDKDGRVKIADFGIAKMLHADGSDAGLADSQPAGTPQYMAPEQKEHRRTDHRADIYSLGVVLYELLTGELPADKLQPPSRKVQIDVRLDEIVLRALETKPELRYQTAGEMRTQVETVVATPDVTGGRFTAAGFGTPPASPAADVADTKPAPQPRWQGWDVWIIGLSVATFGGLWLERLSAERLYQSIPSDNREMNAPDIVLGSAVATVILIVGAAFLWMLAKNIKVPSASRGTSWKRKLGRSIVPLIAVIVLLRAFVVQSFWAATDAASPELPRGSLVVVWKLSRTFAPGELIAYRYKGRVQLGRTTESGSETTVVSRNGTEPSRIPHAQIVGKVISVLWRAPAPSGVTSPAIQRVEISQDKAVVHQARYDGSGLLITFGTGTNRWTPAGRYLDGLFNVTLEWASFGSGARHVIQPRHGIHMNYRLDGPPGPMLGKLVFHPGTTRPDAEGLCVIGEFQPDTGEPLPLAVKFVADQATQPRVASPSSIRTLAPVKMVSWSFPILGIGVIGLFVIGGIVLVVVLVRKGGNVGKVVLALCCIVTLLLAVSLGVWLFARAERATEATQQAKRAVEAKAATPRRGSVDASPIKSSEVAEDNNGPAAIAAAQQQGIASATEDIQAGVLRILAYGDLIPTSPDDKDEETGFRIQWVAGSFLSNAFRAETDAYNFAMRDWFWKNRPDWSAAVTLLLLDADGKTMPLTTVALTAAEEPNSKAGARSPIATRVTDDLGFIHAFSAPTNRQWSVAIVRNGKEGPRSAPIATSVAVNARGGPPNYFLELRATGGAPGDVLLTPLSSEANQSAPKAASDQVLANRLALASLLQKLHQLPATSEEKGTLWLPVPGASVPVTKRVEVAAQIERLRRQIRGGVNGAADATGATAVRYRPAAVSADVRREVDAFIQKYRGASDTEVMESVEFKQAFGKVREIINTPQMQATIAKTLKEISGTKKGSPSMLVIGSETTQGLDSPKNRALFEAAFSGDAELIRAWLTNTLGGAVFEFAFKPALKESSGGVHVKELPAKQRPAVGAALRETNQPPPQAAAPLIRREVKQVNPGGKDPIKP